MNSKGSAVWNGGFKDGRGAISTDSKVLSGVGYSFGTRFEGDSGTNPEELIAAAHAACFSMALAAQLGEAKLTPETIRTTATVTLDKSDDGFTISKVHLDVNARVPGADPATFQDIANKAKTGCPVSKLLKAEISMDAKLES